MVNEKLISIKIDNVIFEGLLAIPDNAYALVIFSQGSAGNRFSSKNIFVAKNLQKQGIATFLIDLLTPEEDKIYETRFNINLLTNRLHSVINYLLKSSKTKNFPLGLFGISTGTASALKVGAQLGSKIKAIVSRGGRPDLTGEKSIMVKSPTLLIVGENDLGVVKLNKDFFEELNCEKKLEIIKGATHLFEEPGKLKEVADLAVAWFEKYLVKK